jgi:hypothetical protein
MMGRIYQSVRDVVVWLGKPNSFSKRGMRWIADNYGKQSNENVFDRSTNPETLFRVDMDEFLQAFSSSNADKPSMKQILHTAAGEVMVEYIFTLRWFMRVWVLQEFILAKELTFVIGDYVVSDVAMFHALAKALQTGRKNWLQKHLESVSVEDYTANHLVHLHSIRMMFEIRFARRGGGGPNHLLSCVLLGWNRRAKITKDKVFGVLGLMDPIGSESPVPTGRSSRPSFNFDYNKDDRTTFVDCARAIIEEERSLVGLSLSRGVEPSSIAATAITMADTSKMWLHRRFGGPQLQCGVENLPTWAIDFTRTLQPRSLVFSYNHSFHSGGEMQRIPEFLQNGSILCLEGILWDEIELIGEDSSIFQPLGYQYFTGDILRILSKIGARYEPTHETTLRAFARTLIVDHPDCIKDAEKPFLRKWGGLDFLTWLANTIELTLGLLRYPILFSIAREHLLKDPVDPEQKSRAGNGSPQSAKDRLAGLREAWDEFLQKVDVDGHVADTINTVRPEIPSSSFFIVFSHLYQHRRLFLTKKGYLGIASRSVRPGHVVAVLPGAQVPFILRKENPESDESAWRLVGEAYVHGIMAGEAASGELQKISIC